MQGYYNENYPGNSKETLKNWKHGTQDIKIAGPFAYLVAYLTHLHPRVSLPRQRHLRTLLHNNKLLIEKLLLFQLFTI